MHLADAFIQSELHCNKRFTFLHFYQFLLSANALLFELGKLFYSLQFNEVALKYLVTLLTF